MGGVPPPIRVDDRVEFPRPADARVAFVPNDAEAAAGTEHPVELDGGRGDVEPVERLCRNDRVGGCCRERERLRVGGCVMTVRKFAVRVAPMASIGSTATIVAPVGTR